MVTICPILGLVTLGIEWLFLIGSDFSMFGLRALRSLEMHVRRDKLEGYLVFFECFAEFFTVFIVEDMKFKGVVIGLEIKKECLPTGFEFCCLAGLDRV